MYKVINIGGNDYKLEYTIEASLYNDCIDRVINLMYGIEVGAEDVKQVLRGVSDIPNIAMSCFYAGLLEHHGTEAGDGAVPNLAKAKRLAADLIKDKDSEVNNWYDLLTLCVNQMGEDGFFELIGLNSFLTTEEKATPKPRTGKKKATEE